MKNKLLLGLYGFLFLLAIFSAAADCPGAQLVSVTSNPTCGRPFSIVLNVFEGSTPITPWGNYTQANMTTTPNLQIIGDENVNLATGYINLLAQTEPFKWELNCTSGAGYNITVFMVDNASNVCNMTIPLTVADPVYDPVLVLGLQNLGNIIANQATNFNLTINNTGDGTAYNISGLFDAANSAFNNQINVASLANKTSTILQRTITTNACGSNVLSAYINNYQNARGDFMVPLSVSDDFAVIGSDLSTTVSVSNSTPRQGQTITINSTITNNGDYQATGASITFYYGSLSNPISTVSLGTINIGQTISRGITWNVATSTATTIYAVVTSSTECSNMLMDNQATLTLNAQASLCGNGLINTGEQCDGSNLAGATCKSIGYKTGTLSCSSTCRFDTSGCSGSSGGGSGGGSTGGGTFQENYELNFTEANPLTITWGRYDVLTFKDCKEQIKNIQFTKLDLKTATIKIVPSNKEYELKKNVELGINLDNELGYDLKITLLDTKYTLDKGFQATTAIELICKPTTITKPAVTTDDDKDEEEEEEVKPLSGLLKILGKINPTAPANLGVGIGITMATILAGLGIFWAVMRRRY